MLSVEKNRIAADSAKFLIPDHGRAALRIQGRAFRKSAERNGGQSGPAPLRSQDGFHRTGLAGAYSVISVPMPLSVNSSSKLQFSTRPSMIMALRAPFCTASRQHLILGIMPPCSVPLSNSASA